MIWSWLIKVRTRFFIWGKDLIMEKWEGKEKTPFHIIQKEMKSDQR
jgi:hypothetical protein